MIDTLEQKVDKILEWCGKIDGELISLRAEHKGSIDLLNERYMNLSKNYTNLREDIIDIYAKIAKTNEEQGQLKHNISERFASFKNSQIDPIEKTINTAIGSAKVISWITGIVAAVIASLITYLATRK